MFITTNNKKWLIVCLCVLMLCTFCTGVSAEATENSVHEWSDAYHAFVMNAIYLNEYPDEFFPGTYEPITFALHDIDRDSVPELIISNGSDFEAGHYSLFFTYKSGDIVLLGTGGDRLGAAFMWCAAVDFPGLFYQNGNMGCYPLYYYSVEGDAVREETVYVDELISKPDGTEEQRETRETTNDALYAAAHGAMQPLPCFTREDIGEKGWAWFVSQYPALFEGGKQ